MVTALWPREAVASQVPFSEKEREVIWPGEEVVLLVAKVAALEPDLTS